MKETKSYASLKLVTRDLRPIDTAFILPEPGIRAFWGALAGSTRRTDNPSLRQIRRLVAKKARKAGAE